LPSAILLSWKEFVMGVTNHDILRAATMPPAERSEDLRSVDKTTGNHRKRFAAGLMDGTNRNTQAHSLLIIYFGYRASPACTAQYLLN
jgi:hypothetical protein